jgi:c-di-GMP-binding flagellar brake protein YcgR
MPDTIDHLESDDDTKFVTVSRLEISQILHALERDAALVTASLGEDNFFLTSILEVNDDAQRLLIEIGKDNPYKTRLLAGQHLACVTSLKKIKIRFELSALTLVTYREQAAFSAPLPRQLMRLQRREYYRMPTPVLKSVTCSISSLGKDAAPLQFNVLEMSCGGITVIIPPEIFSPELGAYYECNIRLPGSELLKTRVWSRNAVLVTLANGKRSQRSGFGFVDLPQRAVVMIQRYLMQLECERKERGAL